ncbi:hypothetical protein PV721_39215 [Streptomyces sp. MB09-01]|uniref:hypothetical protein n=1 Tax=Streptomyces sp. MB09-01 TaxID=3028666 RepID=UPI0029A94962|nr:hypothetical protein [Streptomyces sp. MB09-01]MDX3540234.1 hypothetical protein [Streptomyces sp. MB09-01]
MKKFQSVVLAAAVTVALGACDSSQTDGSPRPKDGKPSATGETASLTPRAEQAQVPPAFDGSKGWAVMQGERLTQPTVAPHAQLVLFRKTYEDGAAFGVEARDARTGAVRWSSAPWKPSERTAEFQADDVKLFVTSKDGKDHAVLVAAVQEGKDAISRGSAIARASVFPADSSGKNVAPARQVSIPGVGSSARPHDANGTLAFGNDKEVTVVDMTTGVLASPQDSRSRDYLLRITGSVNGTFHMADAWPGQAIVPAGAQESSGIENGTAHGVRGGYVVAQWPSKDEAYSALGLPMNHVWALHDESRGNPVYALPCNGVNEAAVGSENRAVLSDNGRYLVTAYTAFDLQAKKGYCFGGTQDTARVDFMGVDNAGTAYGKARTPSGTGIPVSVDIATGTHAELSGVTLPTRVSGDVALYESAPQNENAPAADLAHHAVLSVYPKR